jgi:hypothetical protein
MTFDQIAEAAEPYVIESQLLSIFVLWLVFKLGVIAVELWLCKVPIGLFIWEHSKLWGFVLC